MTTPSGQPVRFRLPPPPEVTLAAVRRSLVHLRGKEELEGFGVFGSLGGQQARVFHPEHSDIDVFLVFKPEFADRENSDRWVMRVMDVLGRRFRRRVDVMTYTLAGLRKVPSWHTLSMASDCPILYDPDGKVADVFRRILAAARAAGLSQTWIGPQRVWAKKNLRFGEVIRVEVPDDDE